MIVVTGATGQLGGAVVRSLLKRLPAGQIVASVSDPDRASALSAQGVQIRSGDFSRPDQLRSAFAGADRVLIVSVNKIGDEGRLLHRQAIEAAKAAGVGRVLYTSHMGTHPASPFSDHAAAEADLREIGIPFTSLRHGFYAESAFHLMGRGLQTGEIRVPADGPVSWTARADLAEADAAVLASDDCLEGISPPLTSPEAFTFADLATIASEATGRDIKRVIVSEEDYRQAKLADGVPPHLVELLLMMFRDARVGVFAATDPTLETLIGRRPQTMRDILTRTLQPNAN